MYYYIILLYFIGCDNIMINRDENPEFLNSFLDYIITILNKSPKTVKEYNYDLNNFLKYIIYDN